MIAAFRAVGSPHEFASEPLVSTGTGPIERLRTGARRKRYPTAYPEPIFGLESRPKTIANPLKTLVPVKGLEPPTHALRN